MPRPQFDRLAPFYVWFERLSFGPALQWCRTALLGELTTAEAVLILGDGDGRFLEAFLRANPRAAVDSIDVSPAMIALARRRVGPIDRVRFLAADVREVVLPPGRYDLIVTHFFLDCFPAGELRDVIARLAPTLKPGGRWLIGDFRLPDTGWRRLLARTVLAGMYLFFRVVTRIPAGELIDPAPLLRSHGLWERSKVLRLGGFLSAAVWVKPNGERGV